jgi:hypothetical protein
VTGVLPRLSCWVPVAHACNPSYSGGRDQEDHSSKPSWANSSEDPISKKTITKKKGFAEWLKVKALRSSPSTTKKKTFLRDPPWESGEHYLTSHSTWLPAPPLRKYIKLWRIMENICQSSYRDRIQYERTMLLEKEWVFICIPGSLEALLECSDPYLICRLKENRPDSDC